MIYVVGLGPGGEDQLTPRALAALERCDVIVGYKTYIDLIAPRFKGRKELLVSPMKGEVRRCEDALRRSREGCTVGVVSSGDPGVYGMASCSKWRRDMRKSSSCQASRRPAPPRPCSARR